jgi:hypothetical protein
LIKETPLAGLDLLTGLLGAGGVVTLGAAGVALVNTIEHTQAAASLGNAYTAQTLIKYPSDLPSINGTIFAINFQFYQYQRPSILVAPTLIPIGAIALPIPADMMDNSIEN